MALNVAVGGGNQMAFASICLLTLTATNHLQLQDLCYLRVHSLNEVF